MVFSPLMEKDKKLMEASWWERLTGVFSKSLIQFSVYGWGCIPSLLFTWGQTLVEVMKIIATSFQRSHACTAILSAPTLLQDTAHPGLCWRLWTLKDKSGSVSCGVTAPFSWVLVLFVPSKILPVLLKFWRLCGGVNGNLLQEGLCHTQVCCLRAPAAVHCWPVPPQEILKHSSVSVSMGSLGPGAHKVCLSPLSVSGGYEVWF